jgi:hypothetical protein
MSRPLLSSDMSLNISLNYLQRLYEDCQNAATRHRKQLAFQNTSYQAVAGRHLVGLRIYTSNSIIIMIHILVFIAKHVYSLTVYVGKNKLPSEFRDGLQKS